MKFSELKGDAYDYDNAVIEECATKHGYRHPQAHDKRGVRWNKTK